MIELPLRIRHSSARREPAAWFIPGGGPSAWLEEIASWGVPQAGLRLRIVPRSRADLRSLGVLVTGVEQQPSPRCLPYGRIARLYLPIEAELEPAVSEEELEQLLASGREYVFHPAAGLCGFGDSEIVGLAVLLQAPPPREDLWDRARPGIAFARRLTSIRPETTPTIEQVLEQGRGDIGTQSNQIRGLPRSPDEPSADPLSQAGRHIQQALARFVSWLTSFAPATASQPTWVNRLQDWAQRQLGRVQDAWNRQRMSEVLRLMRLLESDPDRGLKYALPVGGPEAHRGVAPGGNRLTLRSTDFSLGQLGGGGPVSFWDLPNEYRQQLVARYRELANRELQMGRHRRAAYIFAALLGDLEAAATSLIAGCHWREAAVVYRQKLNRPLDAAKCLERGGLWSEAVALYVELDEYEKAGDLYCQLEQEESARQMYGCAVDRQRKGGDVLGAARIQYDKLHDADGAFATLEAGWPLSSQASRCLSEAFRLRGVLGRHSESHERIELLPSQKLRPGDIAPLAEVLAEAAGSYPDRDVRELAADQARVWASRRLAEAGDEEARRLLRAVEQLAPEDRLLPRDCQRFVQQRKTYPKPIPRQPHKSGLVRCVGRLELPLNLIVPRTAARCGGVIYIAGYSKEFLILVRCRPPSNLDLSPLSRLFPVRAQTAPLLAVSPHVDGHLVAHVPGIDIIPEQPIFPATAAFPHAMKAGGLAGMSPEAIGCSRPSQSLTWILRGNLTLDALGPDGQTISTRDLGTQGEMMSFPIPMHAWTETVCIGLGSQLCIVRPGGRVDRVPVEQEIMQLSGTVFGTRNLLLTFPNGACLYRDGSGELHRFGEGLAQPSACFLGDGRIAVGSEMGLEVYATENGKLVKTAEHSERRSQPIALLPTEHVRRFAVVSANGVVEWFEV